ncbi:cobyric acid synthase [Puia dinghuensis]|uniref:Cobyric acid synthase n=1 Tax=Puia dinghuensis TaxID=1792502 RepID=A0A8J2XQN0_9BACT|nr:cobyric acid synthase [Puia dinghuensis]GGA94346.1 cobyric acid synthase [Puia dinghuensis]
MFAGTASDVGKSVITAGFCRILAQDGYRPAPFKAQNMSLNSFVTPEGLEIGRAQAVQAEAAGIPCHSEMNPVLLKPTGDTHAQLVLHGKPAGSQSAYAYFMGRDRVALWEEVRGAYDRLARRYNPIVLEGAGSISEVNLRDRDIANMRMALHAGADVYLVADIDRGGVFASVYGTLALLPPEERALIRGVIINKFRGDARLFADGRRQLEELTGTPVVGVLPYFRDIHIEEEDSVVLRQKHAVHKPGAVNVAVVRLPHLANFTDFAAIERAAGLHVYYTDDPGELAHAAMIILPGTKNTIGDLLAIREVGVDKAIHTAAAAGVHVIGICGGYQMMGLTIADPYGVEGEPQHVSGMGLLPVHTVLTREKTTVRRRFRFGDVAGPLCEGYEIHMGQTVVDGAMGQMGSDAAGPRVDGGAMRPLNFPVVEGEAPDGYGVADTIWGTYMHGILDNQAVVKQLLGVDIPDYRAFKERQYDRLAEHIRSHVDLEYIYSNLLRR